MSSSSGSGGDSTLKVLPPPQLSAALVIHPYRDEKMDAGQPRSPREPPVHSSHSQPNGTATVAPVGHSQPLRPQPPQRAAATHAAPATASSGGISAAVTEPGVIAQPLSGFEFIGIKGEDKTSPCSSEGGATQTTAANATPESPRNVGLAKDMLPVSSAHRTGGAHHAPVLSSPASVSPASSARGSFSARKPLLSGRSQQLKLQAAATGMGTTSARPASGDPQAPSQAVSRLPQQPVLLPRTPTAAGSQPPTRTTSTAALLSLTTGVSAGSPLGGYNTATMVGHNTASTQHNHTTASNNGSEGLASRSPSFHTNQGGSFLLKPTGTLANGSLSRHSSSGSASFRRHYHLSSIAGCNYGSGANAPGTPVSPAMSATSAGPTKPSITSARHTFQRAPLPTPRTTNGTSGPSSTTPEAGAASTAHAAPSSVSNELKPVLRQEYLELQRDIASAASSVGVASVTALPKASPDSHRKTTLTKRLPSTDDAPTTFQHRRKRTCPLHSKVGRAAEEKRQEAERLRILQQQHHDEQIISNGGREAVDPRMKSSAKIAGSSSKLLQRNRSRQGSFNGNSSMVSFSTFTSRLGSPEEPAGLHVHGMPNDGNTPARATIQNGFFKSPPTGVCGESAGAGPHGNMYGQSRDNSLHADDGEGRDADTPSQALTRNRFGSFSNMNRNGLKGETIVVELQRDVSSSSSSSSRDSTPARGTRSPSPPLASSTVTRNRRTVSSSLPGAVATAGSATGKHRINYHEAPSPAPYRKKTTGIFGSDSDSEDECLFSFQKQRQDRIRRTPLASASLPLPEPRQGTEAGEKEAREEKPSPTKASGTSTPTPATAPAIVSLTIRESTSESQSLAGSQVLTRRSESSKRAADDVCRADAVDDAHRTAVVSEDSNKDEDEESDNEECCYCCPCRRPENFFLLCQRNEQQQQQQQQGSSGSRTPCPPAQSTTATPTAQARPPIPLVPPSTSTTTTTTISSSSSSRGAPSAPLTALPVPLSATSRATTEHNGLTNTMEVGAAAPAAHTLMVEELESTTALCRTETTDDEKPGAAPVRGLHAFGPSRRGGADAEDDEEEDAPLLKVSSFRRSSVRKVSSR